MLSNCTGPCSVKLDFKQNKIMVRVEGNWTQNQNQACFVSYDPTTCTCSSQLQFDWVGGQNMFVQESQNIWSNIRSSKMAQ